MAQAALRAPAATRIVVSGQSLAEQNDFDARLATALDLHAEEIGHGGEGWYDLLTTRLDELVAQARNRPGCVDVLAMFGGQGDIFNTAPSGGQDGATCYQRAVDYADAARAAGFDLVVVGLLPAFGPDIGGTGRPTAAESLARSDANALLLANGDAAFDAVVRTDLAPLDDATDTDWFAIDRLHLADPGTAVAAARFAAAIANL